MGILVHEHRRCCSSAIRTFPSSGKYVPLFLRLKRSLTLPVQRQLSLRTITVGAEGPEDEDGTT